MIILYQWKSKKKYYHTGSKYGFTLSKDYGYYAHEDTKVIEVELW